MTTKGEYHEEITPNELRDALHYDAGSGRLYWRQREARCFENRSYAKRWNGRYAGNEAFTANHKSGYKCGRFAGHTLLAHRVIFAIMTGGWPTEEIDHIDHDRSNNRWQNLRTVSRGENAKNLGLRDHSVSGVPGVVWHKQRRKWAATICNQSVRCHLGLFENLSDAISARLKAQSAAQFHINHGRRA